MEAEDRSLVVVSDWLPSPELLRLLSEYEAEFPQLAVQTDKPEHRGLDPAMAVALVSGVFTLLAPFVTKLVDRVFSAEKKAKVALDEPDSRGEVVILLSSLSEELRNQLIAQAIESGKLRVRISLEETPS